MNVVLNQDKRGNIFVINIALMNRSMSIYTVSTYFNFHIYTVAGTTRDSYQIHSGLDLVTRADSVVTPSIPFRKLQTVWIGSSTNHSNET